MRKVFLLLGILVICVVSVCFACNGNDNIPMQEDKQQQVIEDPSENQNTEEGDPQQGEDPSENQGDNGSNQNGENGDGQDNNEDGGSGGIIVLPPVDID